MKTPLMHQLLSKLLVACAVAVFVTVTMPVDAAAADAAFTYTIENGEAIITGGDVSGDIVFPAVLGDTPVTKIADRAFWWNKNITSITLPEGISSIGDLAFCHCTALQAVSLPNSLKTIGELSFAENEMVTTITIPSGVAVIENGAFRYCERLTSILVDEDNGYFSSIDGNLFTKDGTKIIQYANGKDDLKYLLPESTEIIGASSFFCANLQEIEFPKGLRVIENDAFWGCKSLLSFVGPAGLQSIGQSSFLGCSSLGQLFLPESLESIGIQSFYHCSSLKEVELPRKISTVPAMAFSGCTALSKISLFENVTLVESFAFEDCEQLTDVYYYGIRAQWNCISISGDNPFLQATVHMYEPGMFKCTYSCLTEYTGPSDVEMLLVPGAAYGQDIVLNGPPSGLVVYPSPTLPSLDLGAGCPNLISVKLTREIVQIHGYNFRSCDKLLSIHVESNNEKYTSVDGNLYNKQQTMLVKYAPAKQQSVFAVPTGVAVIGGYAFDNCANLKRVELPESVKEIEEYAFSGTAIESITIPLACSSIASYAFAHTDTLKTVYYEGSCKEWNEIQIGKGNEALNDVTVVYNCGYGQNSVRHQLLGNLQIWEVSFDNMAEGSRIIAAAYNNGKLCDLKLYECDQPYATYETASTNSKVQFFLITKNNLPACRQIIGISPSQHEE